MPFCLFVCLFVGCFVLNYNNSLAVWCTMIMLSAKYSMPNIGAEYLLSKVTEFSKKSKNLSYLPLKNVKDPQALKVSKISKLPLSSLELSNLLKVHLNSQSPEFKSTQKLV